jgi:predicted ribosome quality control (RQC) complex YloA/Tae2 family protein
MGADFPHRAGARQNPVEEMKAILGAAQANAFDPVLYSALPPEEMLLRPAAADRPAVLSPFPLASPPAAVATPCSDCESAVRLASSLLAARHRAQTLAERMTGCLQKEASKLERLLGKLSAEREETGLAEAHQRYGDLILASPAARVRGNVIVVPDLYAGGAEVPVPADPALSPRQNAEKHYARARKLRRGAEKIAERAKEMEARRSVVMSWQDRLRGADTLAELENLEEELVSARLLSSPRKESQAPPEREGERDPGIRKFRTEGGFVILVGKTARDNDRLTFQLAAPHDFWFHAVDRSGAHVVVRNPGRLTELPRDVALAAARIAAHFSRAKGKGKVEVHCTLRKYVRKGRGFGPGRVTIRNHKTLEVHPGIPGGEEN